MCHRNKMLNLKIKVCFVLAVFSIQTANSVIFECKFETATWPNIKNVYSCDVQIITADDKEDIVTVTGDHAKGKDNGDVKFLNIGLEIGNIPTNIGNTFKKLKGVQFWYAGLQSISKDDIKQFSELEIFSVHGNKLEFLDGDLLKHNSKFKWIDFRNNSISQIGPNLLKSLKDLDAIFLSGNICIDRDAESSKTIKELIEQLPSLCPVLPETTSTQSTTTDQDDRTTIRDDSCPATCSLLIDERLQNFEETIVNGLVSEIEGLKDEVAQLKEANEDFRARFIEIEMTLREIGSLPF